MKKYRDFGWYFLPRLFSSCRQIVKSCKILVLCFLNWTECFLGLSILTFYFVFFLWIGFYSFLKNCFIIFVWLHWVFIAVLGPSLDGANRGYSRCRAWASHCGGLSLPERGLCGVPASVVVERRAQYLRHVGFSCPTTCGIFPDQGSNPCLPASADRFLATGPPVKSNFYS